MGIFNNSDVEKRVLSLEFATKVIAENLNNQIALLEKMQTQSISQAEIVQSWFDAIEKRMAIQKTVMETLIEENRKLNEMVTKNGERHIETIAFVEKKLNETYEELHKALLAEKSKLN